MTTEKNATETTTKKPSSKRSSPGIARERFDAAIAARPSNLSVEDKAAWTKIQGPSGGRIYVSRAKGVKQVDLSGFGAGLPGTVKPKVPNGKVLAQLSFKGTEDEVMARFQGVLEALSALPAPEPKAKAAKAEKAASTKGKKSASKKTSGNRKAKIAERATEMGLGA